MWEGTWTNASLRSGIDMQPWSMRYWFKQLPNMTRCSNYGYALVGMNTNWTSAKIYQNYPNLIDFWGSGTTQKFRHSTLKYGHSTQKFRHSTVWPRMWHGLVIVQLQVGQNFKDPQDLKKHGLPSNQKFWIWWGMRCLFLTFSGNYQYTQIYLKFCWCNLSQA